MSPRPGRLLIAEPMLGDHFFQRSVVLLVQHSGDIGSLGFILNKKTGFLLNEVIPELKELPDMDIYLGGPMAPDHLFFVHSLGDLIIPDTQPINEHLYFGGNFEALKTYILAGYDITDKVKFFMGYAGWDKHQLSREIQSNSWAVGHSDDEYVLRNHEEDAYWKSSVVNLGGDYKKLWKYYPKETYLN